MLLRIFDGDRNFEKPLTTVRYDGIVLQGSDTIFNMLLPPLPETVSRTFDVEACFETATEWIPLYAGAAYANTRSSV